jgi:tRNA nucleotidyltransferase (CCA-adding enzyme)
MKETEVIPTSTKVLTIDGKDIMERLCISPGPMVGKILNELLEMVTDNPHLNTKESLLDLSEKMHKFNLEQQKEVGKA